MDGLACWRKGQGGLLEEVTGWIAGGWDGMACLRKSWQVEKIGKVSQKQTFEEPGVRINGQVQKGSGCG